MLSFPLCCVVFGILVFCPKIDGGSLTWQQPLPIQTIQSSNLEDHFSSRQLFEGTINATLNWQFSLNQLNFRSLVILLNGTPIAGVKSSGTGPQAGFENEFGIDWNLNQKLVKLFIFKVTTEKNDTFTCQVNVEEVTGFVTKNFQFTSNVQVHVVDPTNNIVTRTDLDVRAPAELTLNCSADGIPKPTITWTRLSDKTVVTMPLKIIRGKNKESYRCTASNGVGNPLTKDVLVNILFSPKVTLAEKFFVGRGEAASLFCQVEGNPKPTISWSPCDPPLVSCDKQYLNISNVQTACSYFNCTARNNVGIDSATTVLLIGGYNIYLRMGIIEECDKKYSVWEALKKELTNVFEETTQSYSGAELIVASCGSLIFDIVLKFSTEVTEDDTISIIQNATLNGKLGELNINTSYIIGIPPVPQTTTAPTSTTPKSDDNTGLIIGVVLGGLAFVALIGFIIWCVRKKKCCSDTKEVSDNTDSAQERKGKGQNRGDEAEYASTSMLPHSKRPVEKTNQGTVQALPMYAQVDKTKKTSNKGGAAQRQRQPGELQYAEVEHVTSGRSLPRKSSSEPIKPSNEEIVYADLV